MRELSGAGDAWRIGGPYFGREKFGGCDPAVQEEWNDFVLFLVNKQKLAVKKWKSLVLHWCNIREISGDEKSALVERETLKKNEISDSQSGIPELSALESLEIFHGWL